MSNQKLTQPKVSHYLHWLGNIDYFEYGKSISYTEESLKLADELFHLIKHISPVAENGARTIWVRADRGPVSDWGDPEEEVASGEYESVEEFAREWLAWFPLDTEWYEFSAVEDKQNGCRALMLQHDYVFFTDPQREENPYQYDITELLEWLIEETKECIEMLKQGTYNDFVSENIPPHKRTGTVLRQHLFDIYPEHREYLFGNISDQDVKDFCTLASAQPTDYRDFKKRIISVTVNDFYHFCALGYAANDYDGTQLPEKQQYLKHADGRDEGMRDLDPDSEEAFLEWLENPRRGGGHPWEVCRGGNSTHVSLHVYHEDDGYFLWLAGDAINRCIETIKFYLALSRAGLPVYLSEAHTLVSRLRGTENVGIVPDGVHPFYCHSMFPDEHIIDFMHLPHEKEDEILPFCVWQKGEDLYYLD